MQGVCSATCTMVLVYYAFKDFVCPSESARDRTQGCPYIRQVFMFTIAELHPRLHWAFLFYCFGFWATPTFLGVTPGSIHI